MTKNKETVSRRNEAKSLGFVMVPMVILFDNRLNTTQKILWSFLERYAGNDRRCFPGVKRIAKSLGVGERIIQQHLSKLEEVGLVCRRFRDGRSTEYEMQDMEDVYCDGDRQLLDSSLEMLRSGGEDSIVELFLERRREREGVALVDGGVTAPDTEEEQQDSDIEVTGDEEKEGPEKPVRRYEDVMGKVAHNLEKSQKATDRRKERRSKLADIPTEKKKKSAATDEDGNVILSTKDVEEEFRLAAKEAWPTNPAASAPWEVKHRATAKRLCERFGHELTIKVLRTVVLNWSDYVDRFGFNGYPSVFLVAKFADSWFPEIAGDSNIEPLPPRERARREREYDKSASEGNGGVSFIGD